MQNICDDDWYLNKMLLFAIIFISYIKTSVCVRLVPGQPVPNADILDDILTRHVLTDSNGVANIMFGTSNDTDVLDVNILDVDNVRKIVNIAKKKYEAIQMKREMNQMKREMSQRKVFRRKKPDVIQAFYYIPNLMRKSMDMIVQTIYHTKERINETYAYRQKFRSQYSYNIGVLCSAVLVIYKKMESLMAQVRHTFVRTHMLWYIILYEKILACNIDITDLVEKIFHMQKMYLKFRGPAEKQHKKI